MVHIKRVLLCPNGTKLVLTSCYIQLQAVLMFNEHNSGVILIIGTIAYITVCYIMSSMAMIYAYQYVFQSDNQYLFSKADNFCIQWRYVAHFAAYLRCLFDINKCMATCSQICSFQNRSHRTMLLTSIVPNTYYFRNTNVMDVDEH